MFVIVSYVFSSRNTDI